MLKESLIKRLKKHERSQAWLSRKLNISAMAVCKMCNGQLSISKDRAKLIRKWLP